MSLASFYLILSKKVFIAPLSCTGSLVAAACALAGSWCTCWIMAHISIIAVKASKKFLVRKGLRKTFRKSSQNDKEPQETLKEQDYEQGGEE